MKLTPEHLVEELIVVLGESLPNEVAGERVELLPDSGVHNVRSGKNNLTAITFMVGDQMVEVALRVRERTPRGCKAVEELLRF